MSPTQRQILNWYRKANRKLPWRGTRNPYRVLLSEVMLQQTQVSRVLIKYPEFLRRFPNLEALAKGRTQDVIRTWRGMGYNNRAIRLHQIAKLIHSSGAKFPTDVEELRRLPGVGKYTSHAVACFAFGKELPVVDTNVNRVLRRLFPAMARKRDVWDIAEQILPAKRAYDWNQALMDLGSLVCTAANPKCVVCPISRHCPSAFNVKRAAGGKRVRESGRNGIPNRIYRGRIVETLRNISARNSISLDYLASQVKPNFTQRDRPWLSRVLAGLQKDGLVRLAGKNGRLRVALPD
ncbi:MAG: A/G-specific adenine glycosylase [Bacteroidota bacterium]